MSANTPARRFGGVASGKLHLVCALPASEIPKRNCPPTAAAALAEAPATGRPPAARRPWLRCRSGRAPGSASPTEVCRMPLTAGNEFLDRLKSVVTRASWPRASRPPRSRPQCPWPEPAPPAARRILAISLFSMSGTVESEPTKLPAHYNGYGTKMVTAWAESTVAQGFSGAMGVVAVALPRG